MSRTDIGSMTAESEGNVEADVRSASYDESSLSFEDVSLERRIGNDS